MPLNLYAAIALLVATYTSRKIGASINYFVEPCAVLSACAGVGLSRVRRGWPSVLIAGVGLVLSCMLVLVVPPIEGWWIATARWYTTSRIGVVYLQPVVDDNTSQRLLAEVQATETDVISTRQDVLLFAGKRIVFEPFHFSALSNAGTWDQRHIIERLDRHEIGLVMLHFPADVERSLLVDWFCTPEVRAAVRRNYRLASQIGGLWLYRPATYDPERTSAPPAHTDRAIRSVAPDGRTT